ncbi:proteophosphoglycan 5 [Moniliophthora roreri MCA 2997]|uniref:Proteophosphoglycan 5 n=2 Tax=Moniliophthora roreri TaxID=221103 RepID=V2XJ63_MONRO|nr:proteophosphoglycan 5 [Moniliophthora roreri MCA 2997]KAI3607407.1 proteophosphoglycan 5 [Moniliophthora roreri]
MSPTNTRSSATAPYQRRPSSQPKSSRQQFSACGACRMRRVRCDLKDLPVPVSGPNPACSNCRERGLKCVDEFADVKAVKLLRRGRRLQQVEAIYGKAATGGNDSLQGSSRATTIPKLHPDFFNSAFWAWFSLQRPILDPTEFPARYCQASQTLSPQATLITMLLVVWAASYGLDERGLPSSDSSRSSRKERTQTMVREVLEFIDLHAIMRSPTWDGLRVLLLILPLLDDSSVHPLDRLAIHDASLSQVVALCSMDSSDDQAAVRARLFWYAYVQEGITTAIRGGRLLLSQEDLDAFAPLTQSPPTFSFNSNYHLPSPISPTFPPSSSSPSSSSSRNSPSMSSLPGLQHFTHLFSIPLCLSGICRNIHRVLKRKDDPETLSEIWSGLDRCWDDFEGMRRCAAQGQGQADVQVERFVSAWQIFIFECHNVLREFLAKLHGSSTPQSRPGSSHQQYHHRYSPPAHSPPASIASHSPTSAAASSPAPSPYEIATKKTFRLLPTVLSIIKYNLAYTDASSYDSVDGGAGLFRYDTGLVRDGVFYAAFLSASMTSAELVDYVTSPAPSPSPVDTIKQEVGAGVEIVRPGLLPILDSNEGTNVCLKAIGDMRWAFSKSEERDDSIRVVWEERKTGVRGNVSTAGYAASIMMPAMGMQTHAQSPTASYLYTQQPHHSQMTEFYATSDVEMRYMTSSSTSSTPDSHFGGSVQDLGMGHPSQVTFNSRQYHPSYHQVPSIAHSVSHSSSSSSHSSPEASTNPYPHLSSSTSHQHPVLPPLTLNSGVGRAPVTNAELSAGHAGVWPEYTPPGTAHGSSGGSPVTGFKTEAEDFYAMAGVGVGVGVVQGVTSGYLDF